MKHNLFISFLVVMMLAAAVSASSCIPYRRSCKIQQPEDCCSGYCRDTLCIKYGDAPNDKGYNPCDVYECPQGTRCVLLQVNYCDGKKLCPPKPQCR